MKKAFLITLIFLSNIVFSQNKTLQVYLVRSGPYNEYTKEFDLVKSETNMKIFLENSVIRITDKAHSVYIVKEHKILQDDNSAYIVKWEALDEKSKRCMIIVGINRKGTEKTLSVVYNDFVFHYYFY